MSSLLDRLAWWRDDVELPEGYHFEDTIDVDRHEIRVTYHSGREETIEACYVSESERGVHYRQSPLLKARMHDTEAYVYDHAAEEPPRFLTTEFIPYAVCAERPQVECVATETWQYSCDVEFFEGNHRTNGWGYRTRDETTALVASAEADDE